MYILIWTWVTLKLFHLLSFHNDGKEGGKLLERGVGNILPQLEGQNGEGKHGKYLVREGKGEWKMEEET